MLENRSTRIVVRPVEPTDAEALHAIRVGENVFPTTNALPSDSIAFVRELVEQRNRSLHTFVAVVDERVVGLGGLVVFEKARVRHVATLFVEVHQEAFGIGVATALLERLTVLADSWLGLVRVQLEVDAENARAIRLYQRFGFETEGRMRANFLRDGAYVDSLMMARVRSAPAVRSTPSEGLR